MRALALLACLGAAAGEAMRVPPELFGSSCSGSKAPHKTPPACYTGKASVMGGAFSEGVVITIKEYDWDKNTGTMDIHATGVSPEDCKNLPFSKEGQDIKFNPQCLGSNAKVTAMYCSDQDSILLHVTVAHLPIVALPVTLTPIKCAA